MIPRTVAEKYILVPDCDDDRTRYVREDGELQRVTVNHRHDAAAREVYATGWVWLGNERRKARREGDLFGGWYPPCTVRSRRPDRREELPHEEYAANEALLVPKFYPAAVHASWYVTETGEHRLSVWGADDCGMERVGLTEAKATRLWARLNDYVTVKTLWRLGFGPA